jgi:ABC-type transport system involved in multi-copper enzyme maturation permease subunit
MRSYLHEFRDQFTKVTVIGSIALLALIGVAGGYTTSNSPLAGVQFEYSYSHGYHFLVYVTDAQNLPVEGAQVELWVNSTGVPSEPLAFSSEKTDVNGVVQMNASLEEGDYSYSIVATSSGSSIGSVASGLPNPSKDSTLIGADIDPVFTGFWDLKPVISVLAMKPDGGTPSGFEARYTVESQAAAVNSTSVPESKTTLLGYLSNYHTDLSWTVASYNSSSWVTIYIFAANGTEMASVLTPATNMVTSGTSYARQTAEYFLQLIVGPIVALLAILLGYELYGKDRAFGTIESVLVRPVTRPGLFLVRFLAILAVLVASLAIALTVLASWVFLSYGTTFPVAALLLVYGILLAIGAAFAGIVPLTAHLLRSRGGVIGAAIGGFLVFTLVLPSFIPVMASVLQIPQRQFSIDASYFNPIELLTLAFATMAPPMTTSPGGVTLGALGAAAVAWAAGPAAVTFLLARGRD